MFSYEFCERFQKIFFTEHLEHLQTSASIFFAEHLFQRLLLMRLLNLAHQMNWKRERIKTCASIYFSKRYYLTKIKLMVGGSAITKVNGSKNIYITDFSNVNVKFVTFITLNPRGKTRLIFKKNVKTKAWERFA